MMDDLKKSLFLAGMHNEILKSFRVEGPFQHRQNQLEYMYASFRVGCDVNVCVNEAVSTFELARTPHPGDLTKLYTVLGEDAAVQLLDFVADACRFEQHVLSTRWWRLRMFFSNSLDTLRNRWYDVVGFVKNLFKRSTSA
jgi:hypothetical protein